MVDLLAPGPAGMREANVERRQVRRRWGQRSIEDDRAIFVLIETQMQKGAELRPLWELPWITARASPVDGFRRCRFIRRAARA